MIEDQNTSQDDSSLENKEHPDFLAGFYDGLLNEEKNGSSFLYMKGYYQGRRYLLKRVSSSYFSEVIAA